MSPAPLALAEALGWALLHSLWQGAAVAAALAVVAPRLTGARGRYLAATLGLATLPAALVLTALAAYRAPAPALPGLPAAGAALPTGLASPAAALAAWLPLLAALWLGGVLVGGLRAAAGAWLLLGLRRRAARAGGALQARADALARRLGLRLAAPVRLSDAVAVPLVVGWLRPAVVLPAALVAGLPPAQLDALLAHELAHIRRRDPLVNLLQVLVETLFFHHPAAAWISSQVRRYREHLCDDAAVAVCGDARLYARALALLAERAHARRPLALAATGGPVMERVRRLVRPVPPRPNRLPAVLVLLLPVLLAACASNPFLPGDRVATLASFDRVCLATEVSTGRYDIPAFGAASLGALQRAAEREALPTASSCGRRDLTLAYRMRFDARSLSYLARLQALDASGRIVWQGERGDAISSDGAFQYLTESNAEGLLGRFLEARASR